MDYSQTALLRFELINFLNKCHETNIKQYLILIKKIT